MSPVLSKEQGHDDDGNAQWDTIWGIPELSCLNMKVYCTNTCHDISQYLAMERLHPGKKTNQIFSGIDRCYNKAIKDEGITEDYKILIIVLIKVGGEVAGKEMRIVRS